VQKQLATLLPRQDGWLNTSEISTNQESSSAPEIALEDGDGRIGWPVRVGVRLAGDGVEEEEHQDSLTPDGFSFGERHVPLIQRQDIPRICFPPASVLIEPIGP